MFSAAVRKLFANANIVSVSKIRSTSLYSSWYTKLHLSKQPKVLRKNAPVFSFDWEHKRFQRADPNLTISGIEKLPEFQELSDEQKRVFTYGSNPLSYDYHHQLAEFMSAYGKHPADDSLLAKVLRTSFKIWYNKYLLGRYPRVITNLVMTLRGATESLVQRRMRLLRRLRALNKEDYKKALKALNLKTIRHLDPFDFGEGSEEDKRKKKVKNDCYQQRLAKLARFKKDLAAAREEFYERKERDLNELVEKLTDLGLERSDAEAKLRDLFGIVVKERQEEALVPTQVDKLQWYAKERVMRRHVINSLLEKEAKQLRSRRK
ncbi:unnamed protein product [Taenia asiatica]|uniref:Growth arrest and DNA damage-inducible proteins-interacting protein 1 n=1 Tax=Taenia asiatica TaxID=60517 RepID=A0A0R3WF24_TAEAS|nr:unnamed protein product [Taenia asiatica]